ncbi:MAG TPA: hypothetical protein PK040_00330 [Anaerolineaceae bacterium]|nr:hypothetical protein [Anaerolineaceae bacterium]
MPAPLICDYCATLNPGGRATCIACGAPLVPPVILPVRVTEVETSAPPILDSTPQFTPVDTENIGQQLKEGAALVGASLGGLGIGTLVLRTLAEAIAIAVAAIVVGVNSGSVARNNYLPLLMLALVGGGLIGLCVGSVTKRFLFSLLSAPVGALLGSVTGVLLQLNKTAFPWMALLSLAGAVALALLGGKSAAATKLACYQRARPWLGLAGGLLFGLIGFAAGYRIY